jgi:uncharacterized membrane protein (DUF4010 family)
MCARVAVFAAMFGPGILPRLAPVLLSMAVIGGAAGWLLVRSARESRGGESKLGNPFSLKSALTFGAIYALIQLLVKAAQTYAGAAGVYVAAALSGIADVDAITIALIRSGPGDWRVAAFGVSLALVVNTLFKLGLAVAFGTAEFRLRVSTALGGIALAGGAAAAVTFWYLGAT